MKNYYAEALLEWIQENPEHEFIQVVDVAAEVGKLDELCKTILGKLRIMDEHITLYGAGHECGPHCFLELELEETHGS